jgi:hypothetical protein
MAKDKELLDHERAHSGVAGSKVRHGADAAGRVPNPNKITSVYSGRDRGVMTAVTKDKKLYRLNPEATNHRIPQVGETLDPSKHYRIEAYKDD